MEIKMNTFKGGIHPDDKKSLTRDEPIINLRPGKKVYIPMLQHIGAVCQPLVAVGDYVLVGQKIGESTAFIQAPVHSSVSGSVCAIENHLHPGGQSVLSIVIENDGLYRESEDIKPRGSISNLTPEQIVSAVKEAGIVGMGGAGFPTFVKLSPPKDKKIDTVLINGAECEPYLTSDYRVMKENPDDVIEGLRFIMKAVGASNGIICIEDNKKDVIELMCQKARGHFGIEVKSLKTKYPQGSEKQLIEVVTKRQVPSGKLPADVGIIVDNIDTAAAIYRSITTGMPLISRVVTVSGGAIKNCCNYRVRIGTLYSEIIDAAGGFKEECVKVLSGGPMMGIAQYSLDVPVIKTSSAILCFTQKEVSVYDEYSCIRCGKCASVCPMRLLPMQINANVVHGNLENAEKLGVTDCIECGSCSYICPSKRYLVQSFRQAKTSIIEAKRKAAAQRKGGN